MIFYSPKFLEPSECEYFINLFNQNEVEYWSDEVYKFYHIDLIKRNLENDKFVNFNFRKFRVQMTYESIDQVRTPHRHLDPWSFVIFLNENFVGGEIIFTNRVFSPTKGDMIYFSGNEKHLVKNCIGNRFTLVGFMSNNPLNIEYHNSVI